jgi:hypothetical protein
LTPAATPPPITKVNRSRLAFFIAEYRVFTGVSVEACGLRDPVRQPLQVALPLSPGPSSLPSSRVKILKSGSTKIMVITDQWLTRGLFKRLDGVIA